MINGSWFSGNRSPSRKYTTTPLLAKTPLFYSPAPPPASTTDLPFTGPGAAGGQAPDCASRTVQDTPADPRHAAGGSTPRCSARYHSPAASKRGCRIGDAVRRGVRPRRPMPLAIRRRANVRDARGPLGRTGGSVRYRASEDLPGRRPVEWWTSELILGVSRRL